MNVRFWHKADTREWRLVMRIIVFILAFSFLAFNANAESVSVKYRGAVDLAPFKCNWINRSSLVNRLCYDEKETYVVVMLRDTYYHYCEVPKSTVAAWFSASSMGSFITPILKEDMTVGLTTCPFMTASHKTKIGYQVKNFRMTAFGTK